MSVLAACFLTPLIFLIASLTLPDQRLRRVLGPLLALALIVWACCASSCLLPAERLLVCSLWLLYVFKGWSLLLMGREFAVSASPAGLLLFAYVWPGVDPHPFAMREATDRAVGILSPVASFTDRVDFGRGNSFRSNSWLISVQISSNFEREKGKSGNGPALGNSKAGIPVWGNLAYVILKLLEAIFDEISVIEGLVGLIGVLPRDRRWASGIAHTVYGF